MSRWTETNEDVKRYCNAHDKLFNLTAQINLLTVNVRNHQPIAGRIVGISSENNGGKDGQWSWRGSVTLRLDSGEKVEIDLLDIESVAVTTAIERGVKFTFL